MNVSSVQDGVSLNQNSSAIAVSLDGTKVYVTTGLCSSLDRDCGTPSANEAIQPDKEPVKLQVGPFIGTFPIGSFKPHGDRTYTFAGTINGAELHATIERTGVGRYRFRADAKDINLAGITNPVQISLSVGDNAGLTSVKAR